MKQARHATARQAVQGVFLHPSRTIIGACKSLKSGAGGIDFQTPRILSWEPFSTSTPLHLSAYRLVEKRDLWISVSHKKVKSQGNTILDLSFQSTKEHGKRKMFVETESPVCVCVHVWVHICETVCVWEEEMVRLCTSMFFTVLWTHLVCLSNHPPCHMFVCKFWLQKWEDQCGINKFSCARQSQITPK